MAGTTKAAEKAVQEATEATTEVTGAKEYKLRSANKYLTVSSLGVQFMAGKYTTTDPAVAKALMEIDGVDLED